MSAAAGKVASEQVGQRRVQRFPQLGVKGVVGSICCLGVIAFAALGPLLVSGSPLDFVAAPFSPPAPGLPLGSDALGRDALVRLVNGGAQILILAFCAAAIGVTCGALIGICAAYSRGVADNVIMRLLDVVLAFPQTILALLFVSILGPRWWIIMGIVAVIHVPEVARVVRSAALRIVGEEFVQFAEMTGTSRWRIVVSEILPNLTSVVVVEFGLRLTYSIAIISVLSFLGFGQQPPVPDWGLMINENRIGLAINPWPVLAPVALIALITIGINLLADALLQRTGGRGE